MREHPFRQDNEEIRELVKQFQNLKAGRGNSFLEEEAFEKLPAAVFVRGFIVQIAKSLKLPPDQVAPAYMSRYKR